MDPVDWKVVTEKLSQLDIWSGESLESSSIATVRLPPPFICCVSQLSHRELKLDGAKGDFPEPL